MTDFVVGKSIIITGAAGGFGKLLAEQACALGANITCVDVDEAGLAELVASLRDAKGKAIKAVADVSDLTKMKTVVSDTMTAFRRVDVIVNNAGVMPLGLFSDHEIGAEKWSRCIDINFKGVLNGIIAVYDQMMAQGEGHVINISSIYGNFPVSGAGVYGATKSAVNYLSESLRVEARGKIKVTNVKPTGVPGTKLSEGVVNRQAALGIVGHNAPRFVEMMDGIRQGVLPENQLDPGNIEYVALSPHYIVDQIIHSINQPKGVSISEITVRASADHFIL